MRIEEIMRALALALAIVLVGIVAFAWRRRRLRSQRQAEIDAWKASVIRHRHPLRPLSREGMLTAAQLHPHPRAERARAGVRASGRKR